MDIRNQLKAFGMLNHGGVLLHHMEVFLFVGEQGRATYANIEQEFSLSNAAVSRTVRALSDCSNHCKRNYGLTQIDRDPYEGRRHLVRLTTKGQQLYEVIMEMGL